MQGKFNLGYFLKGAPGGEDWFKAWGMGWRLIITLLIILFLAIMIYRAFFMKQTQTQTQTARIIALPGSNITYAPQQEQKQEIKKRPWWLPSIFTEVYGFSESGRDQRTGLGGRGGLHWEW